MKKFLMIAVAAMAVASQAASVQWQLNATKDSGYAAGQTVLLFLGAASETFGSENLSLADYVDSLLAEGADAAEAAAFDTATTTTNPRLGTGTAAQNKDISYAAKTPLVGMIVVLDGNGKYSAFSLSASVAENGYTMMLSNDATSSTGGFVDMPSQIPEPATGALALAGLALLFRRRR